MKKSGSLIKFLIACGIVIAAAAAIAAIFSRMHNKLRRSDETPDDLDGEDCCGCDGGACEGCTSAESVMTDKADDEDKDTKASAEN